MKNSELIYRVTAGVATPGQRRLYADRVTRQRVNEHSCVYGHFGCALIDDGPCLDETLGELEG